MDKEKKIDIDKAMELLHNAGISFGYGYNCNIRVDKPSYVILQKELPRLFAFVAKEIGKETETEKEEAPEPSKTDDTVTEWTFLTPEELAKVLKGKKPGKAVDFTFDTEESLIGNPSGWYGIKVDKIFDEPHGVLCLGDYGSTFAKTEGLEDEKPETLAEAVKRFLDAEAGYNVTQVCVDVATL